MTCDAAGGGAGRFAPHDEPAASSEAEAGANDGPVLGVRACGEAEVVSAAGFSATGREEEEGSGDGTEPVRSAAAAETASSLGGGGLPDGGYRREDRGRANSDALINQRLVEACR